MKRKTYFYIIFFLLLLALSIIVVAALSSLKDKDAAQTTINRSDSLETPYTIITTVSMLADSTRNITGKYARVTELMGPGVDPHLYLTARSDILQINNADIVFYIGMLLEGQLSSTLDSMHNTGKRVYPLAETLDASMLIFPDNSNLADPHVWMDIGLWIHIVDAIAAYVIAFDPARENYYIQNTERYKKELEELEIYALTSLATVQNRTLITAHDAFNYFGKAYDFDVIGIQGISTESEAGIADINTLVNLIIKTKVPTIFFESTISDKYVRALVEGAANQNFTLAVGEELFSDAMGAAGTMENTYIGMLRSNINRITAGLGGGNVSANGE